MGTSGDRKGYKIFSFNTTVRNPKRNTDFLKAFEKYSGQEFTDELAEKYFFDIVKQGIYKFLNISESVKNKLANGIELTPQETHDAIKDNPQATGLFGRVKTQLRSMKDLGFLIFDKSSTKHDIIALSKLGKDLIDNEIDATAVYTKSLIGIQANSPIRVTMLNQSRPFLNTLFVIKGVNEKWKALGFEPKGILRHEFSTFVLSMKDCNYQKAIDDIIEYRKKNKYKLVKLELKNYLKSNNILPLADKSIFVDYPDDVFRKFEMTGLLRKRGQFNYIYYDFSEYNIEKIELLLAEYKDYKFNIFDNADSYYEYLYNIDIPWLKDETIREKIVESKAKILNISIDKNLTLSERENMLDRFFYSKTLEKVINNIDYKLINKELLILSGTIREKSKYDEISEPLRLEYMLALLFGKKYGLSGLVSNIIYGEDGSPLHFAPASKCDMIYLHEDGSFILEPTMQRGKSQILNNETANIVRHMKDEMRKTQLTYRVMMIAPYVHEDVAAFFQFKACREKVKIAPINIDSIVGLLFESDTVKCLCIKFDNIVNDLINNDEKKYIDKINSYRVNTDVYQ